MTDKLIVQLKIVSHIGDEMIHQSLPAQRYSKGANQYFRYEETEQGMGRTVTIIKVGPEEIKVIRQGDVESEQTFVVNEQRPGFYRTPQGTLQMSTRTSSISVNLQDGLGSVSWSYDLLISGESTGHYRLELEIAEA